MLLPSGSWRLSHQVKLSSSFPKTRSRKSVSVAAVDQEDPRRGDRVDRRVDVVEVPLVGRDRPVRVLEPLAQHHDELVLGERRIEVRPRHRVEGQVPGREPRVLPGVRHREDVEGVQVAPPGIASGGMTGGRSGLSRVTVKPLPDPVRVELLAPDEAGGGLPEDAHPLLVQAAASERPVELVGLALASLDGLGEGRACPGPRPLRRGGRSRVGGGRFALGVAIGVASGSGRWRRSRSCVRPPPGTVHRYHQAALVPVAAGLTVAVPAITWSLIPSLGYALIGSPP